MKSQITSRLEELQAEYQKGQERLNSLQQELTQIQNSMLRISGAIQVLQELLQQEENDIEEVNEEVVPESELAEKPPLLSKNSL